LLLRMTLCVGVLLLVLLVVLRLQLVAAGPA
jgi:hypothetical protein